MMILLIVIVIVGAIFYMSSRNKRISSEIEKSYQSKYQDLLSDSNQLQVIDDTEIVERYKLTSQDRNRYSLKAKEACLLDELNKRKENNMLSPDNYKEMCKMVDKLQLGSTTSPSLFSQLSSLKKYWEIIYLPLPIVQTNINLQKNEVCYYSGNCTWHETRSSTRTVSYSGFSSSIKIAKGLRYTVGSYTPNRITQTHLQAIDSGKLFVTNKRIIFMGALKNSNIRFPSVLSITPYSDAVGVEKSSGKSPILSCTDPDILTRILLRTIYIGSDDAHETVIEALPINDPIDNKVLNLLMLNRKLDAVKLLHDERGMTLKEAKDYVDSLSG